MTYFVNHFFPILPALGQFEIGDLRQNIFTTTTTKKKKSTLIWLGQICLESHKLQSEPFGDITEVKAAAHLTKL